MFSLTSFSFDHVNSWVEFSLVSIQHKQKLIEIQLMQLMYDFVSQCVVLFKSVAREIIK